VLTVDVWPATVTTDGKVAATGATADDTGKPFVCADDAFSTSGAGPGGGTAVGLVTAAAAAAAADGAGGCAPATRLCCAVAAVSGRDVDDDVPLPAGRDCAACTAA